ncbi:MAG: N-acetylmuramoyl-L-alanine amidase [Bacillota bacterium]|nr:N-acetylmuramoyl-L-alanine amidase [Bacillota bacterium]
MAQEARLIPVNLVLNGLWQQESRAWLAAGVPLVPVRRVAEALGAIVEWQTPQKAVLLRSGATRVVLVVGRSTATINEREVRLPRRTRVVENQVLVAASLLAEAFGAGVEWEERARVVRVSRREPALLQKVVAIDPGHGGKDSGALGATGLPEKEVNLEIARRVGALLRLAGGSPALTRESDRFLSLPARVEQANRLQAEIFVSIHHNWAYQPEVGGTETYYYLTVSGHTLASQLQRQLVAEIGLANRGVKEAAFYVLRYTRMPASLCEVAFLSNPEEERLVQTPEARERIATAIYRGIRAYFEEKEVPKEVY